LAAPILSIGKFLEWQDPILLSDAQVDVKGVGKFTVRAHSDDLWHVLPWRERAIFAVLREQLRPGDTFIDAGANIGVYSVFAARLVGSDGKVLAVEMMSDTADRLKHNLALNGISNVAVCHAALSNTVGQLVTAKVTPGKYGQASISKGISEDAAISISVKTTTLDEISKNLTGVRLVKMDLEGAEALALLGAKELLNRTDYLICESWRRSPIGNDLVDACLSEATFTVRSIDGNNLLAEKTQQVQQEQLGIPR
jgi:FkbM family methyltransferase